jgi:hypothetical protein
MILDRLKFGCKSGKLTERLINDGATFTMDNAIQIAQSMEYAKHQMMIMGHNDTEDVHHIQNKLRQEDRRKKEKQIKCFRSGAIHTKYQNCPAKEKKTLHLQETQSKCNNCGNSIILNLCVDQTVYM